MAIKQRKQLTGTTAQINAYDGIEGQLVWDKTKKTWVGMSGSAGFNYPMASESHTHSISNVTGLQDALDGKLGKTEKANSAKVADTAKSVAWSNVTDRPSIPSSIDVYVTTVENKGTMWYRKWSNGFIEQGDTAYYNTSSFVSFGWPFTRNPSVMLSDAKRGSSYIASIGTTGFTTNAYGGADIDNDPEFYGWYACGF